MRASSSDCWMSSKTRRSGDGRGSLRWRGRVLTGKRTSCLLTLAALAVAFAAWAAPAARTPSPDEVYGWWGEAAKRFEASHTFVPDDSAESRWVARIGREIVGSWPDRRWVEHQFRVVRDASPGAWSFPTSPVQHRVYITTGLLDFIRSTGEVERDDQLAGVIGHEVAHLMRDHHILRSSLYRSSRQEIAESKAPEDLAEWPARVLGRWQREDEFEADRYGAFYAMHAGYRFSGVLRFLALYMRGYGDDRALDFSGQQDRTHPTLSSRIAALEGEREQLEEAQELFEYGLDLLRIGAWGPARVCFAKVRNTFWLSPTVLHDLGYAELRQYETGLGSGQGIEQCVSVSYLSELSAKGDGTSADQALLAEAKRDFLKACELDRQRRFSAPRLGLAWVYLHEGDDATALDCLQELRTGLDEAEYLNLAGVIAERRGDTGAAARAYRKALRVDIGAEPGAVATAVAQHGDRYLPAAYNLARIFEADGERQAAAELYRVYVAGSGTGTQYGSRAVEGLIRCGGEVPGAGEAVVADSYRGVDLGASGPIVVEAALGKPDSRRTLADGRNRLVWYLYPSQGIVVTLVSGPGDAAQDDLRVRCISVAAPSDETPASALVGKPVESLAARLGGPEYVNPESAGRAWWGYARYGLAYYVEDGFVRRCLIGGRR